MNHQNNLHKELISGISLNDTEHVSLCETLDHVLNTGVVVVGEVMLSVADIDLVYLGLQLVLTSVETAREYSMPMAAATANGR